MFTIYADGKVLYAPNLVQEGYGVFSPKLTVELNKAGSLEFTLPPNNVMYDQISKLKTIITVFQNEDELFRGRILHDDKVFYRQKKTYCEGELAFLLDSRQRPYTFEGTLTALLNKYISNHNSRVDSAKQFTVGKVSDEFSDISAYFESTTYPTTLDELSANLIDIFGGYVKTRGSGNTRYIDYLVDSGELNSQTIEFGVNLLDISEYISAENIITVLIPIGANLYDESGNDLGKVDITSINSDKDYIENATAISLFGRIEHMEEWTDVEDPSELKTLGEELLTNNIEMSITLTVKAVDLHILDVNTERIRLGDWVRVISIPHGLDKQFQCTKIVYDLIDPDRTEYVFGVASTSLTEKQVNSEKGVQSSVSTIQSAVVTAITDANKAAATSKNVESVIATLPTEYVQTKTFESYKQEVSDNYVLKTDFTTYQTTVEEQLKSIEERLATLEGGTA